MMDTKLKWKLIAVAVGVAAAAAGGVAISSAAHSSNAVAAATGDTRGFGGAQPGNGRFGPPGGGGPRGFGGQSLAAASTYLGLSTSELLTKLQAGTTLAAVANGTSGRSAAGLIAAMVAAEKQQIEQAVTAGTLTRAQADQTESALEQRVADRVNGSFRGGPLGGPPGNGQDGSQSGPTLKRTV
jgi:hypothetical protein